MTSVARTLDAYAGLFERFSPQALDGLGELCRPDVEFRDPFHAVVGLERMKAVFAGMFDTFEAPRFVVRDRGLGASHGFILWSFDGRLRRGGTLAFDGMTSLQFDRQALVLSHVDHWDAASAIHGNLPVIGPLVRYVNRRIRRAGGQHSRGNGSTGS